MPGTSRGRAEIDTILHAAQVCRLAFALANEPYLVPVSFGYDGCSLNFHTAYAGHKTDCLEANPRVCFEVEHNVHLRTHPTQACRCSFSFGGSSAAAWCTSCTPPEDKEHRGMVPAVGSTPAASRSWHTRQASCSPVPMRQHDNSSGSATP